MTDPSLAAQVVLDAYETTWGQGYGSPLAAALRAVVLKCEYSDDYGTSFINPDDILAIANDLEA